MATWVLLSGGIDSMVVLHLLTQAGRDTTAVHIDFGQPAREQERTAAIAVAREYRTEIREISAHFPQQFGPGEIRFRNGFLIFAAAVQSNAASELEIAIGTHAGVSYPDCSERFIETIATALSVSIAKPVQVLAPLKTWTKADVIAYAVQESLPIQLTYSCEAGTVPPCGRCQSCLDRMVLDALRPPRI